MMIEDCSLTSWWNSGGLPAGEQATVNAVDKEVPNNLKVEEAGRRSLEFLALIIVVVSFL